MHGSVRLLISVGFLLLPGIALAADLETGLAAYMEGDYETSLAECTPLAEEGIADAQFCIGRLYASGFGVAMNDDLALQWYGRAAEQGHSEAQFRLAVMHANGWGVVMNDEAAASYYQSAAEGGYVQAQNTLAELYENGRGVEQNFVEAYTWFYIAAQLGDLNAEFSRDEIASDLSPEQLAAAQQVAAVWFSEHPDSVVVAY
jgi:TPR repeat protein